MHIKVFDIKLQAATCDQYKGRGYIIINDYHYDTESENKQLKVCVPREFFYDGASIPSILWFLIYNPFDPVVMEGALVHDWLYSTKVVDRKTADNIFRAKLKQDGTSRIKRFLMWFGVRIFGGFLGWPDSQNDKDYMKGLYAFLEKQGVNTDIYNFPDFCKSEVTPTTGRIDNTEAKMVKTSLKSQQSGTNKGIDQRADG